MTIINKSLGGLNDDISSLKQMKMGNTSASVQVELLTTNLLILNLGIKIMIRDYHDNAIKFLSCKQDKMIST